MISRMSSGSSRAESAVEPTRSQNMTVSWRRSADPATCEGCGGVRSCPWLLHHASCRQFVTAFQAEFGTRRVRVAARRTASEKSRTALQAELAAFGNVGLAARTSHGSSRSDDAYLNILSRIAQLDQRTALPDQCLHSAEADVRPPRRKSGFDPEWTLAARVDKAHPDARLRSSGTDRCGNGGSKVQRRTLLIVGGRTVMAALAAATGGPNLLFARDRTPSSIALEERIADVLATYDAQGNHRTGTSVDNASAQWLARQVQQSGAEPELEPFALSRVDPQSCHLRVADRSIAGVPLSTPISPTAKEYAAGLDPSVATSRSGWQKPSRSASRRGSERKRGPSRKRDRVATRRWF